MIASILILLSLPSHHPESTITCRQYFPGTNHLVPAGVVYNYTPEQSLSNKMRCYCETVKPLEHMCITRGYSTQACKSKTNTWVGDNLREAVPNRIPRLPRRNVILNIR